MSTSSSATWSHLADIFALCGNLLLAPMNQTSGEALDSRFWKEVSRDWPEDCKNAAENIAAWCTDAGFEGYESLMQKVGVEYTKLFIGPPKPLAPPWESMYVADDVKCGFGEPTFKMKELLRKHGVVESGPSNQYEDHLGIELLLLSVLCRNASCGETEKGVAVEFAETHPAKWFPAFADKSRSSMPFGYYPKLNGLIQSSLSLLV